MPRVSLRALQRPAPTMYLGMELIPKTAWYVNVRTKFSKEHWDIIRKEVYRRADYHCQICGGQGPKHPVECHEKWEWDEAKLVQKLVGFMALCPDCHGVKHIGYSQFAKSKTALEKLYRHQRVVNKWRKKKQLLYFIKVQMRQDRRNALKWTVDISYARKFIYDLIGEVPK